MRVTRCLRPYHALIFREKGILSWPGLCNFIAQVLHLAHFLYMGYYFSTADQFLLVLAYVIAKHRSTSLPFSSLVFMTFQFSSVVISLFVCSAIHQSVTLLQMLLDSDCD
jgi:hypothetical protein